MAFLIEVIPMLIEGLPAIIEAVGSALGIVSDVVAGEATVVEGEATVAVGLKVVAAGLGGAAAGIGVGKLVAEKDAKEEVAASTAAVAVAAAAETFKLMKAAEAAKEAAEKAMAAEAAVWKEAMLETKAGLEEALKSEAVAVKVVERSGGNIHVDMVHLETRLKLALQMLKAKAKELLIEPERPVEGGVPTVYRKILAGLLVTLSTLGIKWIHLAIKYMLGTHSNLLNEVNEAKEIVDELHERVGKLTQEDSPSMVQTNDETHEQLMNIMYHHLDSTKQEIEKLKKQLQDIEEVWEIITN